MTTFRRYLLIQIPGWILAAVILAGLRAWADIPFWVVAGLYAAYVIKDFVLYPFLRRAYEPSPEGPKDLLVGETAVATEPIHPNGFVRLRGELWMAELAPGVPEVPTGDVVRVVGVRDMTLIVAPQDDS